MHPKLHCDNAKIYLPRGKRERECALGLKVGEPEISASSANLGAKPANFRPPLASGEALLLLAYWPLSPGVSRCSSRRWAVGV